VQVVDLLLRPLDHDLQLLEVQAVHLLGPFEQLVGSPNLVFAAFDPLAKASLAHELVLLAINSILLVLQHLPNPELGVAFLADVASIIRHRAREHPSFVATPRAAGLRAEMTVLHVLLVLVLAFAAIAEGVLVRFKGEILVRPTERKYLIVWLKLDCLVFPIRTMARIDNEVKRSLHHPQQRIHSLITI